MSVLSKDYLFNLLEGKIDFEGQIFVERIVKYALIGIAVLSFAAGFFLQNIRLTFIVFGLSTVVLFLTVLPPWPVYNRHPVTWLPVKEAKSPS